GCTVVNAGDKDETPHVWTRENLLHNIETSLRRLQTDFIDVWQMHNPTVEQVQAGDLVRVMEEVKAAGKVRFLGISSTLPHITTFISWGVFDTYQIPYSALEHTHEAVISAAAQSGAGTIIRGGVARGAPEDAGLGNRDRWASLERAGLDELRAPGESR